VACLHLSLGASDQVVQLAAVADALREARAWVAMGDFNCGARSAPLEAFCEMSGGKLPLPAPKTYPSWRPRRDYDHIVSSGQLSLTHYRTEAAMFSDHLPVSASVTV
jgi:endonuclease/exonuclease/phosphatase family metal-dependent hydrolase